MRAYYLGTEWNDLKNSGNLLFVKTWVKINKHSAIKDEKLIALYHPSLIGAAEGSRLDVFNALESLVRESTGVTEVNVYHGIVERYSPVKFIDFFLEENENYFLSIFVPKC